MLLSILIPSIPERKEKLLKLLIELNKQTTALYKTHPSLGTIEVLYDDSIKFLDGGMSIGMKRGFLLRKSSGKYICFLDDDDWIAPNYTEQLVRMCEEGKDVVTFRTIVKNDHYWAVLNMSLQNTFNTEVNPNTIAARTPWHICPVLREYALTQRFKDYNHNEDWDWTQRVLPLLTTETHTDMILTQYNHSEAGSEADNIVRGIDNKRSNDTLLISLAIDGREKYSERIKRLQESLKYWEHDVRIYKNYPEYCTPHTAIPYKFKYDLIKKAREDGYKRIFWLDSSMQLTERSLLPLLGESGVMAFHNLGHPLTKYISDLAVKNLEVTEAELTDIPQTWGGALGFDFNKDKACSLFEEVCVNTLNGSFEEWGSVRPGFISHRHDQAVMSVLLWKYDIPLLPYGKIVSKGHAESKEYGDDYHVVYG